MGVEVFNLALGRAPRGSFGLERVRLAELAFKPACCMRVLRGIGTLTVQALEGALSLAAGRERQCQRCPAFWACRLLSLSHVGIFAPVLKSVNLKRERSPPGLHFWCSMSSLGDLFSADDRLALEEHLLEGDFNLSVRCKALLAACDRPVVTLGGLV
jgi:hypothetical protein